MKVILYFQSPIKRSDPGKLEGARDIAKRMGWHVQSVEAMPTKQLLGELKSFWNPIGVIVDTDGWKDELRLQDFKDYPTVFLDLVPSKGNDRYFTICLDSESIGMCAAKELLVSGRDNFAYIPFYENRHWSEVRGEGFRKALAMNGKTCHVFAASDAKPDSVAYRQSLTRFLLDLPRPCAVFAANDETAERVMTTASLAGLNVPDDLSVLGVDNYEPICEATSPTLSSIELDFRRCGELAVLMMEAVLRDGKDYEGDRRQAFGMSQVVRRASTRIARGATDREVQAALDLIRREACNGLQAETVMKTFACSRPIAAQRFKSATGHTILQEIHAVRLARAKTLLKDPNRLLKSISDFCGFKDPNSLRKFFLKETGMTMSEWRERNR